jgi:hypothetical protein
LRTHNFSGRNWHFHLIYYDRPCRRISASDIANLGKRGFRTEALEPGMWDFTVVTPKRGRTNGKATPLKQNKVAEVTGEAWIKTLRHELASITNRHLARAGVERRLDPRRYTEMDIVADPQEHLGSSQAVAETRGETTKTGSANELRQWKAIMAEGDARYQQMLADADDRVTRYRRTRRGPSPAGMEEEATALRDTLHRAARLDDIAFRLRHGIERARSRASHVRQANRQLVQAFDADPAAGRPSERDQSERLVAEASDYLGLLSDRLTDERALLASCRRDSHALRHEATAIENDQRVETMIVNAPATAVKPNHAGSNVVETENAARVQRSATERSIDPKQEVTSNPTKPEPAAVPPLPLIPAKTDPSEAARRAAMAAAVAAARSAGR